MKDRLVTVIGGGGFLGRYVAQALLRAGVRVRVAERDPRRAFFLKSLGQLGGTQLVAADVTRPDTIARAVEGSHGVVNLVGSFAGNLQRIHVDGAGAVGEAAARAGAAAVVHVSAIGADPHAASVYGRTKGEGEAAVRAAFPGTTILRPSTVFGREDQFLNRFAGMIARLPVVPVLRPGVRFQPVFAADVGDAVLAALSDPGAHGGRTYELAGPDVLSMIDLHRWIARTIGRDPTFLELPDAAGSLLAALPGTPISADQWKMLARDAVATEGAPGLAALGVAPTPLDAVAPSWLVQFRRAGRFGARTAVQS